MYTTIIHPIRKALRLSLIEYVILEEIRSLSNAGNAYGGWCVKSKKKMAETLDVGESTIHRSLNVLEERSLIERSELGHLKCTNEWLEIVADKDNWSIANRKISMMNPETIKPPKSSDRGYVKMTEGGCQNDSRDTVKMTDKYNIEKNSKNILPEIIDFWNGVDEERTLITKRRQKNPSCKMGEPIMTKCRGVTPSLEKYFKKHKGYQDSDFLHSIKQYAIEIVNRVEDEKEYHKHRFSLADFLKQENGFIKFLNYNREL